MLLVTRKLNIEGVPGGHRCAALGSMGSRVNTVKREGFHSVHARVSRSKLALSSGVLEGLGQVGAKEAVEAGETEGCEASR